MYKILRIRNFPLYSISIAYETCCCLHVFPFIQMVRDYTPLGSAGSRGQHACCRIILDAGGDVNSRDSVRYYLTKHRWHILHHDNSAYATDDEYWVLMCLAGGIVYFSLHNLDCMIHLWLLVYTSEGALCPGPYFFPCLKVDSPASHYSLWMPQLMG